MGNPFEDESLDLYSLDTKDVIETEIAKKILKEQKEEGTNIRTSFQECVMAKIQAFMNLLRRTNKVYLIPNQYLILPRQRWQI